MIDQSFIKDGVVHFILEGKYTAKAMVEVIAKAYGLCEPGQDIKFYADLQKANFSFSLDELSFIAKQNQVIIDTFGQIRVAILCTDPSELSQAIFFEDISTSPTYVAKVFSFEGAAMNWLNQLS